MNNSFHSSEKSGRSTRGRGSYNGFAGSEQKPGYNFKSGHNLYNGLPVVDMTPKNERMPSRKKIAAAFAGAVLFSVALGPIYKQAGNLIEKLPAAEPAYTQNELDAMPHKTIVRDEPGMYAEAIARESNPAVFDGDHPQEASDLVKNIQPLLEHDNPRTVSVPVLPEQRALEQKES